MTEKQVITISKEQVAPMPMVTFGGGITVINTPEEAAEAFREIEKQTVVGFDTETRPTFHKTAHPNKVALMQVSVLDRSWLFRINKLGVEGEVKRFIENENITKVGLSLKDDFFVMHRSAEFTPAGFVDLQQMVKSFNIVDASLQKIYAILFGYRISKGQRLSNWEAETLTAAQQHYAAIDAWACLRIYNTLTGGEFDPQSSQYLTTITIEE